MKLFLLSAIVVLCFVAVLSDDSTEEKKDFVKIGVKYRPETCERKSKKGDTLKIHYTGTLQQDGSKFDSSRDRGDPFSFKLGAGQVIKGWDQGLNGMCIGEKRTLTIPSSLGYGARGSPPKIPGGATLVFETELIDIV